MKKITSSLIASLCLLLPAHAAEEVDWSMIGGQIFANSNFIQVIPDGTLARFGTFGTGYDFSGKSFSDLNTDFTTWESDTSMFDGQFYVSSTFTQGPLGTPWYIFIGDSASSFGVFGNSLWVNTGDIFPQFADLTDPGTFAAGGFGVIGSGSNADNVALVFEPSSALLIGLGAAGIYFLRRRRQQQA